MKIRLSCRGRGSTLVMVVILVAVAAILSFAVMTAVLSANNVSARNANAQQAYFTARSAVSAMASYITNPADAGSLSSIIPQNIGDSVTSDGNNMGSKGWYQVTIKRISASKIKLTALARYPGRQSGAAGTASRYLEASGASNIYSNLLYVNSTAGTSIGQCSLNGNIATAGPLYFAQGTKIKGDILTNGNVTISDGGSGTINTMRVNGDVIINAGGTITQGDIYATGKINLSGNGRINGNVYANGSLTMSGSGSINKNAAVGGDATFSGNPTVGGNLTAGGSCTFLNNCKPVKGTMSDKQKVAPVSISSPTVLTQSISIPSITAPLIFSSSTPESQWSSKIAAGTISQDCIFNLSSYTYTYGSNITVDTSAHDISLLINSDTTLPGGMSINVSGSHNLYIYLADGAALNVTANNYIGVKNNAAAQQVYIMGNGSSPVHLTNTHISACLYLPSGSISADGNSSFTGSAVVKNINAVQGVTFLFKEPQNIKITPIGVTLSSWGLGKWSQ